MSNSTFILLSDIIFLALVVCTTLSSMIKNNIRSFIFIAISWFMVLLTISRPIGLSVDDPHYEIMATFVSSADWSQIVDYFQRDFLYFFPLKLLTDIFEDRSFIAFSGLILTIKLFLIRKTVENYLFALYAYFCISYFLHDITQLRTALSLMFVFLGIFYIRQSKSLPAIIATLASGLAHFSGLVALFFTIKPLKSRTIYYFLPALVAILFYTPIPDIVVTIQDKFLPDVFYITRYTDSVSAQILPDFNKLVMLLYLMLPLLIGRVDENAVTAGALVALIMSSAALVLFAGTMAFALRFNEFLVVFYIFLLGNYRQRGRDPIRIAFVGTVGLFYVRYRYINLLNY